MDRKTTQILTTKEPTIAKVIQVNHPLSVSKVKGLPVNSVKSKKTRTSHLKVKKRTQNTKAKQNKVSWTKHSGG